MTTIRQANLCPEEVAIAKTKPGYSETYDQQTGSWYYSWNEPLAFTEGQSKALTSGSVALSGLTSDL